MVMRPDTLTARGADKDLSKATCSLCLRPITMLCAYQRRSQLRTVIIRNVQRFVIGLLVLIISSIVGPGVFVVLPELCQTATANYVSNLLFTGWLVFNVVFNLVAATVKPAGMTCVTSLCQLAVVTALPLVHPCYVQHADGACHARMPYTPCCEHCARNA